MERDNLEKKLLQWTDPGVENRFIVGSSFWDDYGTAWEESQLAAEDLLSGLMFDRDKFITSEQFYKRKEISGWIITYCIPNAEQVTRSGVHRYEVPPIMRSLIAGNMKYIGVMHVSDGRPLKNKTKGLNLF